MAALVEEAVALWKRYKLHNLSIYLHGPIQAARIEYRLSTHVPCCFLSQVERGWVQTPGWDWRGENQELLPKIASLALPVSALLSVICMAKIHMDGNSLGWLCGL